MWLLQKFLLEAWGCVDQQNQLKCHRGPPKHVWGYGPERSEYYSHQVVRNSQVKEEEGKAE